MKEKAKQIMEGADWTLIKDQPNIGMMQFQSGADKINIYYTTMTVGLLFKGQESRWLHGVKLSELKKLVTKPEKESFWKRLLNAISWGGKE